MKPPLKYHKDELTRRLYAGDASLYEEIPKAVVFPKTGSDFSEIIDYARAHSLSITMRAAGTSLAGQATGKGLIVDISRFMNQIVEIDPRLKVARVEPGVIRDQLNREAAAFDLLFGPDTSTTNRCMMGGMIGNNSCGSYSIRYGTTRDHVIRLRATLSDGSDAEFHDLNDQELSEKMHMKGLEGDLYRGMIRILKQHRDLILERFPHPEVKRRNTGYALDALCHMHPIQPGGRPFNLCSLLCGSEGTLAMVSEAEVLLQSVEKERILFIPHFNSVNEALKSTLDAVAFNPSAVELVDDYILDATKGNLEQVKNRFFLKGKPKAILIIEFQGDDPKELEHRARQLALQLKSKNLSYANTMLYEAEDIKRVWELRKAGLGLLMGYLSDSNSPEFVDDTAVRVQDLPEYIDEFSKILAKYGTRSVYYAHASVGELHLRPILNIKTTQGLDNMKAIAVEVADLVKKYRGSLSGEHGDGRLRSHLIERMVGPEVMAIFREVKHLWDPDLLFNRGKIIDPEPVDTHLRYSPAYKNIQVESIFHWSKENGFGQALEQCNGAGVCRKKKESGGTMCPSYMATLDEKDSTRGRANLFRQIFSEKQHLGYSSEIIMEALELCLSCKACKTECPANVDMAKMKAEFLHGWHQLHGIPLSSRFFGNATRLYPVAGSVSSLVNWLNSLPPIKGFYQQLFGIHPERTLPAFARQTFTSWHRKSVSSGTFIEKKNSELKVLLIIDWFTDYHEPHIARSAWHILKTLGVHVVTAGPLDSGRSQISRGLLDQARTTANDNIRKLIPYIRAGFVPVGLEPSEILTFRDEYPDLCETSLVDEARILARTSCLFEEYISDYPDSLHFKNLFDAKQRLVYVHGHCYTKALTGMQPLLNSLNRAGYCTAPLDTGCCGMAGSFGYSDHHYPLSMKIGEMTLFPALRSLDRSDLICAHGFSCRHQIHDGTGRKGFHTAELIWECRTTDF